ncbi:hypothetical protein Q5741_18865 [Paenibacillus sp. JX-17]|uniref:Uncharacterized protein n=1 Tax=Paenibacillus lacisoli TaxID=3064525 RepID=A0ABT9CGS3_9BACL|nr:hypothetical protein [Paenibacillus sp. JX-17]MDO7908466.1 hypothetical protein [Paenibacillus sp. JX-17]
MTQQIAEQMVDCSNAMAANTAAVQDMLQQDKPMDTPEFQKLWKERDDLFRKWRKAAHLLQLLSPEEALLTFKEMERLRTA